MIGIEVFAGAGGMSHGAQATGVQVRSAIEINKAACATFSANHPHTDVINSDVAMIERIEVGERNAPVILFGGPPCQGFSTSNQRTRNKDNQNNWLFLEFFRISDLLTPDWIVIENVAGIMHTANGDFLSHIASQLYDRGYEFTYGLLQAAEHAVPQRRQRFFLVARKGQSVKPLDSIPKISGELTVRDAISDLPLLKNGDAQGHLPYRNISASSYANSLRGKLEECEGHLVTRNAPHIVERYPYIPSGGNWSNIPEHLMGSYKDRTRCHSGIYHRLSEDRPSIVLGNFRKNMLIHPTQDRGLSIREAARIQSFPDNYKFFGSIGFQQQQVGNAVPPRLAEAVFSFVMEQVRT
jgi:DNA (cytosine-5)-methyltransferase 1